jgi:F-type H+-transporting ATPase subunit delta
VRTFEVSSAVSVTPQQQARLRAELERLEGGPVFLEYRIDPGLVGGLSLRKGNIILDVSVQGRLAKLKEKMIEG